jgi:uncharacterized membrane protein YbhN (UPF0104 family)
MKRWIWGGVAVIGLVAAVRLLLHFPWPETGSALVSMRLSLLATALLVNLFSPLAKGWAWHLLLRPVAPHRWRTAQEANLVGTAVNSVSVGVTGEAARVSLLATRSGAPAGTVALSVAWTRAVEGIGLALFLVSAPALLHLPPALRGVQLAAGGVLVTLIVAARLGRRGHWIDRLPGALQGPIGLIARMGMGRQLVAPVLLALANWVAQWMCYDLVLRAAGIHLPVVASLTALLAVNIGGLGRLTPGNLGVTQAAIVGALLPFGVSMEQGLAAGLALQAIQVLPVLGLAAGVVGVGGLRSWLGGAKREPDGGALSAA